MAAIQQPALPPSNQFSSQLPVVPLQPRIQQQQSWDCCSILFNMIEVIAQLAIRAIFVFANILMTAAVLPFTWHSVAVPLIAIGSTVMAAFFFPGFQLLVPSNEKIQAPRPLPTPANGLYPDNYPIGSPVGYNRMGQNCAFNAAAHFLDCEPRAAAWVRQTAVADRIDLASFIQYLNQHRTPQDLITSFQQYVALQPPEHPSVPEMFVEFLNQYQSPVQIQDAVRRIRGVFSLFQNCLPSFYRANDEAINQRKGVSEGRSENLRASLSAISPSTIPASNFEQTDAGEIITQILDFAPDDLKMHVERTYHFNMTEGLPPMAQPRQPLQQREAMLTLPLDRTVQNGTSLETLLQAALRSTAVEPQRYLGNDHQFHDYPVSGVVTEFVEPPAVVRFQLNRFTFETPAPSFLSKWLPSIFPPLNWRGIKLNTLITCPDEIDIPVRGRGNIRYRLAGFVTQDGTFSRGHYTSGEVRNGHKFLHNDSQVTHVESPEHQEYWDHQLSSAYLLCYVPVHPVPAQPVQ